MFAALLLALPLAGPLPQDAAGSGSVWRGVSAAAPEPESADRFGEVPAFEFTEAGGARVSRADLLGAPWLAVPFFVKCAGP